MIHGIYFTGGRAFNIRVTQCEFPDRRIQCKPIYAPARRVHQHGRRTIDNITGRHLLVSCLQEICRCCRFAKFAHPSEHTEDGTDRYIHIYIAAAIQRIEEAYIF